MNDACIVVLHQGNEFLVLTEVAENLELEVSQDITDEQLDSVLRAHHFYALCERDQIAEVQT